MNKKIRRMMREIERRGGKVGVSDELPDEIAEEFLQQVLHCPDCAAAAAGSAFDARLTIDKVLAGTGGAKSETGH